MMLILFLASRNPNIVHVKTKTTLQTELINHDPFTRYEMIHAPHPIMASDSMPMASWY